MLLEHSFFPPNTSDLRLFLIIQSAEQIMGGHERIH